VKKKKKRKLRGEARALASKFIAEEVRTGKYPREQAVAVGISRAMAEASATRRSARILDIMDRYR
jgi:hypothetical protein